MNLSEISLVAALLAWSLAGCNESTMNALGADMHAALADAGDENRRHTQACIGARSLPDIMDELGRHKGAMTRVISRMDDAREDMSRGEGMLMSMPRCTGSEFQRMSQSIDDLRAAMSEHVAVMQIAGTPDAAGSECGAHEKVMAAILDSLSDDLWSMPCMYQ